MTVSKQSQHQTLECFTFQRFHSNSGAALTHVHRTVAHTMRLVSCIPLQRYSMPASGTRSKMQGSCPGCSDTQCLCIEHAARCKAVALIGRTVRHLGAGGAVRGVLMPAVHDLLARQLRRPRRRAAARPHVTPAAAAMVPLPERNRAPAPAAGDALHMLGGARISISNFYKAMCNTPIPQCFLSLIPHCKVWSIKSYSGKSTAFQIQACMPQNNYFGMGGAAGTIALKVWLGMP